MATPARVHVARVLQSSFGYDFEAVNLLKPNRVVDVLPTALQEIQMRMISPLQALSRSSVRPRCLKAAEQCWL